MSPDGIVPEPTCECASIGTERYGFDGTRMPGEQGDLLMGRRIVEPNTNAASDRKSSAVWRILYFIYNAFTEARFSVLG